jgi:hypothetical protein
MAHRKTNTKFVRDLMEYARSGPLMQAFVVEAISKYAERCAAADPPDFDSPMLSGVAWHACAVEAKAAITAHLGT